jgi:hypothetical protein
MRLRKRIVCLLSGAALTALAASPVVYAQAAGAGAPGAGTATTSGTSAGSAAGGAGAIANPGSSATSPSTLGGSVSGSSSAPAIPGSTAGDSAVNPNNPPAGIPPAAASAGPMAPANQAVQQRSAQGDVNQ